MSPDLEAFWQRPKRGNIHYTDPVWFDKIRVGHGPIENFMQNLSKEANLSRKYTNHSIRSTVMGLLGEEYEGRIVIGWSGHKFESTVKQYICKLPAKRKKEISHYLGTSIKPKVAKIDSTGLSSNRVTTTVSAPPNQQQTPPFPNEGNVQENTVQAINLPPQYDLQALDDAPADDILLKVLEDIEKKNTEIQQPNMIPIAQNPQMPLVPNNTMNIQQNVSNVQNVNAVKPNMVPMMYFGGNSNVTINYNFNSSK